MDSAEVAAAKEKGALFRSLWSFDISMVLVARRVQFSEFFLKKLCAIF